MLKRTRKKNTSHRMMVLVNDIRNADIAQMKFTANLYRLHWDKFMLDMCFCASDKQKHTRQSLSDSCNDITTLWAFFGNFPISESYGRNFIRLACVCIKMQVCHT